MPFLMSFFTIINYLRLALPGKQQLCRTPSTDSGPQRYCSRFWQAESLTRRHCFQASAGKEPNILFPLACPALLSGHKGMDSMREKLNMPEGKRLNRS